MADAPHFAYPFRINASGVNVVEEDSFDELASIAWLCARTPPGSRAEAPDWGTRDLAFTLRPSAILASSVASADDRIAALTTEQRDAFDAAVATITLQLSERS